MVPKLKQKTKNENKQQQQQQQSKQKPPLLFLCSKFLFIGMFSVLKSEPVMLLGVPVIFNFISQPVQCTCSFLNGSILPRNCFRAPCLSLSTWHAYSYFLTCLLSYFSFSHFSPLKLNTFPSCFQHFFFF